MVLPLSTAKSIFPLIFDIRGSKTLPKDSIVLAGTDTDDRQIPIEKLRGSVDFELMEKVEKAMKISIGVDFDD